MLGDVAALLTAVTGAIAAGYTLHLNRQRSDDDRAAALIDDLEARTEALGGKLDRCEDQMRITADYVLALRRALLDAGITPPPWPHDLGSR